jgi:hypothetical protein
LYDVSGQVACSGVAYNYEGNVREKHYEGVLRQAQLPAILNTDFPCAQMTSSAGTVKTGMTVSEVIRILGSSYKAVQVHGNSYVYEFTDYSVTFREGKVVRLVRKRFTPGAGRQEKRVASRIRRGDSQTMVNAALGTQGHPIASGVYEYQGGDFIIKFENNQVEGIIKAPIRKGMTRTDVESTIGKPSRDDPQAAPIEYQQAKYKIRFKDGRVASVTLPVKQNDSVDAVMAQIGPPSKSPPETTYKYDEAHVLVVFKHDRVVRVIKE